MTTKTDLQLKADIEAERGAVDTYKVLDQHRHGDPEIAAAALTAMTWDVWVPDIVKVEVAQGHITAAAAGDQGHQHHPRGDLGRHRHPHRQCIFVARHRGCRRRRLGRAGRHQGHRYDRDDRFLM